MRNIRCLLVFVLIIILNITVSFKASAKVKMQEKQILIINSFAEEHTWTNDLLKGMLKTFNHSEFNTSIYIESFDYRYCQKTDVDSIIYNKIQGKYNKNNIDMVISTDLRATEFVIENQDKLFKDIPIVFSGITKAKYDEMPENIENVTGVVERPNIDKTLKTAINVTPDAKKIYVIHDNTKRGKRYLEEIKNVAAKSETKIKVDTLEDIEIINSEAALKKISKDSIIIGTTLLEDENGMTVSISKVARKISKEIELPIFYLQESAIGHGILGGNVLSPEIQGVNVGDLALRILRGEKTSDIGFIEEKNSTNIFDYNVMKRFNISEKLLPKDSIILNRPYSVYEEYKNIIIGTLALIAVLLFLIIYLFFNIKKRKQAEKDMITVNNDLINIKEELEKIAYYDDITGLANRDMFYYNMNKKLSNGLSKNTGAILYLDIDDFKDINDIFGHTFGDLLLLEIGNRLKSMNNTKKKHFDIYRIGGDEYLLDLAMKDKKYAKGIAKEIKNLFKKQFIIRNQEIKISASIGIVMYPKHSSAVEDIFKKVELAMYKAKELGKNCYKVYEKKMEEEISERVRFEKNLKEALAKDEFILNYQPQIDLKSEEIVGFESLIRWNSSEYGLVSPMKFIPIAEATGEIRKIGEWIIREVCKFTLEINNKFNKDLKVSINISPIQLKQDDFIEMIKETINEIGVKPEWIGIEVTETALMESFEENFRKLEILRDMGLTIYLDDFGTGYSSLNYLLRLPISTIKIDKSFIDDMMISEKGRKITDRIIKLAHDMNLDVVAEGVEEENQLLTLKNLECDIIQGYIYGKPMSEEDAKKYINNNLNKNNEM